MLPVVCQIECDYENLNLRRRGLTTAVDLKSRRMVDDLLSPIPSHHFTDRLHVSSNAYGLVLHLATSLYSK